jgi:hypothetical protein
MRTPCFVFKSFPFSVDGINATTAPAGSIARIPADLVDGLTKALFVSPVSAEALLKIAEGEGEATFGDIAFVVSADEFDRLINELGLTPGDFGPDDSIDRKIAGDVDNKMLTGAEENKAHEAPVAVQGATVSVDAVRALAEQLNDPQKPADGSGDDSAASSDPANQPGQGEPLVIEAGAGGGTGGSGPSPTVTVEVTGNGGAGGGGTSEPREAQRAVVIPADWRDIEWNALAKLAASVSSRPITNKKSAVAAIEAELKLREGGN